MLISALPARPTVLPSATADALLRPLFDGAGPASGTCTFAVIRQVVDDVITDSDAELVKTMRFSQAHEACGGNNRTFGGGGGLQSKVQVPAKGRHPRVGREYRRQALYRAFAKQIGANQSQLPTSDSITPRLNSGPNFSVIMYDLYPSNPRHQRSRRANEDQPQLSPRSIPL